MSFDIDSVNSLWKTLGWGIVRHVALRGSQAEEEAECVTLSQGRKEARVGVGVTFIVIISHVENS